MYKYQFECEKIISNVTEAEYQFKCECGETWEDLAMQLDSRGPLKCPNCGKVQEIEIKGIGNLVEGQLGKTLGKYSWCSRCEQLTLNVPGISYSGHPIAEHEPGGWCFRGGEEVTVTDENKADLFFGCAECHNEKFWAWGYHCPRCDYGEYAVIQITEPRYNMGAAMEFGGSPLDWDEEWKCLVCGFEYWISNGNY